MGLGSRVCIWCKHATKLFKSPKLKVDTWLCKNSWHVVGTIWDKIC